MKKFRKTYIEITTACNLDCSFCGKTDRPALFMDPALFDRILESIKPVAGVVHLHVMGEPTLHPDLGLFLDSCAGHGYRINIVTNGTTLATAGNNMIGKSALQQVSVSLQAVCDEKSAIRINEYLRGLYGFIAETGSTGNLTVALRYWRSDVKSNRWNTVIRSLEEHFGVPGLAGSCLSGSIPVRLAENVWLNTAPEFDWPDSTLQSLGTTGFCQGLRDQFAILVDGTVVPCCLDRNGAMVLGNVAEKSVLEILSSERALAIRNGFRRGIITEPLCQRCSYRLRFTK